jgi:hypothetical protein
MVCGAQGYNPWKFFEAKLEWAYSNEKFEEDRAKGYFPNQVASVLASGGGAAAVRQSATAFADFFWDIWRQTGHRLPEADAVVEGTDKKLADFVFMFCMSCDRQSLVLAHGDSDTVRHTHDTHDTTRHDTHTTHTPDKSHARAVGRAVGAARGERHDDARGGGRHRALCPRARLRDAAADPQSCVRDPQSPA